MKRDVVERPEPPRPAADQTGTRQVLALPSFYWSTWAYPRAAGLSALIPTSNS